MEALFSTSEVPRPATEGSEGAQAKLVRPNGGDGRLKKSWELEK
jgi:hypothetical protein